MEETLKTIVADILDLDAAEITDDLGPGDAEYWDSMNHLRIVTAIEQEFDIKLSMDEIQSVASFADFRSVVQRHRS